MNGNNYMISKRNILALELRKKIYNFILNNPDEMIKSRAIKRPFLELLKQYPNMFPILQLLLQRLGL
jgi:hypothetical protein